MITGINHVGLVVKSVDETLAKWALIYGNVEEIGRASYPDMGQVSCMVKVGDSYFELMEPLGEQGVVPSYLASKGEGFHHVSLHSDALADDCARMSANGVRILGRPTDAVVFTHPKTSGGVLCEITESRNEKVDM